MTEICIESWLVVSQFLSIRSTWFAKGVWLQKCTKAGETDRQMERQPGQVDVLLLITTMNAAMPL